MGRRIPYLDKILRITISRKLLVWIVGTIMVILGKEISDNWLILSGIYLGIQGIIDILKEKVKSNSGGSSFFNNGPFSKGTDNFEK